MSDNSIYNSRLKITNNIIPLPLKFCKCCYKIQIYTSHEQKPDHTSINGRNIFCKIKRFT